MSHNLSTYLYTLHVYISCIYIISIIVYTSCVRNRGMWVGGGAVHYIENDQSCKVLRCTHKVCILILFESVERKLSNAREYYCFVCNGRTYYIIIYLNGAVKVAVHARLYRITGYDAGESDNYY